MAKSVICNKHVSINEMIDHIFLETEKAFKGTTHEDELMIYHDALSLFVAKESYEYMKNKGVLRALNCAVKWIVERHTLCTGCNQKLCPWTVSIRICTSVSADTLI